MLKERPQSTSVKACDELDETATSSCNDGVIATAISSALKREMPKHLCSLTGGLSWHSPSKVIALWPWKRTKQNGHLKSWSGEAMRAALDPTVTTVLSLLSVFRSYSDDAACNRVKYRHIFKWNIVSGCWNSYKLIRTSVPINGDHKNGSPHPIDKTLVFWMVAIMRLIAV